MTTFPIAEDPIELLKSYLVMGIKATPLCVAVVGWLCETRTEPSIAEIKLTGDGQVRVRLSDETALESFGSLLEFLDQIRIVCKSLNLTDAQTRQIVALGRHRLA